MSLQYNWLNMITTTFFSSWDDIWTFYTSLQRPLFGDLLFLELAYTYATANSDYDYARYERNVISAALSLSY